MACDECAKDNRLLTIVAVAVGAMAGAAMCWLFIADA